MLMLSAGMFQRLEKLRKNAFASVIVSGVDNNNTITGIWIMRGQDLAFTVSTKQFLASYHFIVDGWRQSILCCCCICTTLTVMQNGSIHHVANGAVSKPELGNTVPLILPLTWNVCVDVKLIRATPQVHTNVAYCESTWGTNVFVLLWKMSLSVYVAKTSWRFANVQINQPWWFHLDSIW